MIKFCLLIMFATSLAFADAEDTVNNPLYELMEEARKDTLNNKQLESFNTGILQEEKKDPYEELLSLVEEVENLKSKVVATKQNTLATRHPRDKKKVGSITYYSYREGQIYTLHTGVDRVSDILLQVGETLTGSPISGDTVRWKVSSTESGVGINSQTHILIKPLEEGIETNFIITTNKRTYHIKAISSDWYMPQIAWNYPDDEFKEIEAKKEYEKAFKQNHLKVGFRPEDLDFNFNIRGDEFFKPIRIFTDGSKSYIQMPKYIEAREAPALFVLEEDEALLTNYRVKGDYYIYDGVFNRAQLRVGKNQIVDVYRDGFGPTLFERLFE